jgi:hypothetical protein
MFGVRVALGATPRHIRRSVLGHAGIHLLPGLIVGLPLAPGGSRVLSRPTFFRSRQPILPCTRASPCWWASSDSQRRCTPPAGQQRTDPMITLRAWQFEKL